MKKSNKEVKAELSEYFNSLHPADITEHLQEVEVIKWPKLLKLISDSEKKAQTIAEIDQDQYLELFAQLRPEEIVEILCEMQSNEIADIISKLSLSAYYEILYRLSVAERHQILLLLGYPEDSAGGIMEIELAIVNENSTVQETITRIRELVEMDELILTVWVTDNNNSLVGSVSVADLLIYKSTVLVKTLMETNIIYTYPFADQNEVAQLFKKYDLLTLPVVDSRRRLLGRISVDDIVNVLVEEVEEDSLRIAGTSPEELLSPGQILATSKIRLPWLAMALLCSLISASLLSYFHIILEELTVIYAFLPVIMAMGGNFGTQTSTILIRGFAINKNNINEIPRLLFKEIQIAFVMGIFYGLLAGIVATFFLTSYNYVLGVIVFISMILAMISAAILGTMSPTILKKLDIDPAVSAGPFVTTFNDITGIVIFIVISQIFNRIFGI